MAVAAATRASTSLTDSPRRCRGCQSATAKRQSSLCTSPQHNRLGRLRHKDLVETRRPMLYIVETVFELLPSSIEGYPANSSEETRLSDTQRLIIDPLARSS